MKILEGPLIFYHHLGQQSEFSFFSFPFEFGGCVKMMEHHSEIHVTNWSQVNVRTSQWIHSVYL